MPASAGAGRGAAGHLVALGIPRLGVRVGVGLDPRLGGGHQFLDRADELVDQAGLLGLGRVEASALRQHVHERVLDAEHPHGAGHPAPAGQQAQCHLGEAHHQALDVGGDAVVTRERDLQAAAERGAVDRGDHRLAQRLQCPQVALDGLHRVERLAGVLRTELDHALEVTAGEEGLLRTGDDHTGDRVLLRGKAFHRIVHGFGVVLVHHVRRPGRVVKRQRDDAVGILVPLNGVLCHGLKPSQ